MRFESKPYRVTLMFPYAISTVLSDGTLAIWLPDFSEEAPDLALVVLANPSDLPEKVSYLFRKVLV